MRNDSEDTPRRDTPRSGVSSDYTEDPSWIWISLAGQERVKNNHQDQEATQTRSVGNINYREYQDQTRRLVENPLSQKAKLRISYKETIESKLAKARRADFGHYSKFGYDRLIRPFQI